MRVVSGRAGRLVQPPVGHRLVGEDRLAVGRRSGGRWSRRQEVNGVEEYLLAFGRQVQRALGVVAIDPRAKEHPRATRHLARAAVELRPCVPQHYAGPVIARVPGQQRAVAHPSGVPHRGVARGEGHLVAGVERDPVENRMCRVSGLEGRGGGAAGASAIEPLPAVAPRQILIEQDQRGGDAVPVADLGAVVVGAAVGVAADDHQLRSIEVGYLPRIQTFQVRPAPDRVAVVGQKFGPGNIVGVRRIRAVRVLGHPHDVGPGRAGTQQQGRQEYA